MTRDLNEIIDALPEPLEYDVEAMNIRRRKRASVRMKRRNPAFSPEFRRQASERMKALHDDPEFEAERLARESVKFKRLNKSSTFQKARLSALRAKMATPEYRERIRKAALKRWAKARGE